MFDMIALVRRAANGDLAIRTPYDAGFVAALKDAIPHGFRAWNQDEKTWAVEAWYADVALGIVRRFYADVRITDERPPAPPPPPAPTDPFRALHLLPTAPAPLIHAAYKTLARLYHPDAGGSTETMQRLNAAYDTLKERTA